MIASMMNCLQPGKSIPSNIHRILSRLMNSMDPSLYRIVPPVSRPVLEGSISSQVVKQINDRIAKQLSVQISLRHS
jgi:hypothetical protein